MDTIQMTVDAWNTYAYDLRARLWELWRKNGEHAKMDAVRDLSGLTPQLKGLEGWRVEVVDNYGDKRRFIVGKSAGWKPCHLEIQTVRSLGGVSADESYKSVRAIRRVR